MVERCCFIRALLKQRAVGEDLNRGDLLVKAPAEVLLEVKVAVAEVLLAAVAEVPLEAVFWTIVNFLAAARGAEILLELVVRARLAAGAGRDLLYLGAVSTVSALLVILLAE